MLACWRSDVVVCHMTDYLLTEISICVISEILRFGFTIPRFASPTFPSSEARDIDSVLTSAALTTNINLFQNSIKDPPTQLQFM